MPYLLAGPLIALVGIVAVFFVMRRKSVEKRSMYSARRSQIEHKVRAARQRTLAPHGRTPRPAETIPQPAASTFAPQGSQPVTYIAPAYEAPPAAPPAQPQAPGQAPWDVPAAAPSPNPWDVPHAPAPAEPAYAPPQAEPAYAPPQSEPAYQAAPEPSFQPAPSEPAWTPAPEPAAPAERLEPAAQQTSSATAAGSWSIVTPEKESAATGADGKKKDRGGATGSWQLTSGEAPGLDSEEPEGRRSNATLMAVAQYAVLVVGLVMVLIGVIVMVANSHVT